MLFPKKAKISLSETDALLIGSLLKKGYTFLEVSEAHDIPIYYVQMEAKLIGWDPSWKKNRSDVGLTFPLMHKKTNKKAQLRPLYKYGS